MLQNHFILIMLVSSSSLFCLPGIEAKGCKEEILITNLDATLNITSDVNVDDNIFELEVSTKKGYPMTMVTSTMYFTLTGKDDRDVTVATCLKAGVTHELMIESDSDKSCDADTGILTVVVEGTTPLFSVPVTNAFIEVTSSDVVVDEVIVYDITITNDNSCTNFSCDVICTSSVHVFHIAEGSMTITTTVSDLTYNMIYELSVTCYDTNAQSITSVAKSFNVIFTNSFTSPSTSTTSTTPTTTTSSTTTSTTTSSTTSTTSVTSTTTSTTTSPSTSMTSPTSPSTSTTSPTSTTTLTTPTTTTTSTTAPTTPKIPATSTSATTFASTTAVTIGSQTNQKDNNDGIFDQSSNIIAIATVGGIAVAGAGLGLATLIYRIVSRASRISPGSGRRRIGEDEEEENVRCTSTPTVDTQRDTAGSPTSVTSRTSLISSSGSRTPVSLVDLSIGEQRMPKYFHWNEF